MSFYQIYEEYSQLAFPDVLGRFNQEDVERVLQKTSLTVHDFLILLSPAAGEMLEEMAQKANRLSLQHFGRAILLYTPLYLANHCSNQCVYCGFNVTNKISRKKLTLEEVEREAQEITKTGLRHVLILTGESRIHTPVSYIRDCVQVLRKYFSSINIEIYPLLAEEYRELVEAGVDGLTIYQETYNEKTYDELHISGEKKNYRYRLDAPERACEANIRTVNVGALLGLDHWQRDIFFTGLHATYLQDKYLDTEVSVSTPRIRPHVGGFQPKVVVKDRELVQAILAFRLFMPRIGVTVSTRESAALRDNLIPLGVTKMSAGSTTAVGGHSLADAGESQFEISDSRNVEEMRQAILAKGYQPIFKDWWAILE